MNSLSGFRILPVVMIVAAICFGLRFSEVFAKVSAKDLSMVETAAGDAAKEEKPTEKTQEPPAKPAEAKKETVPAEEKKPAAEDAALGDPPKEEWKGPEDLDDEYSDVKMQLFEDLSKRRKELDAREKELAMRDALLKAAQAELEQKTTELGNIKADIESLLKQQTQQEDKRILSLVKIYEGMKAKDAARIFDSLEMDVLLQVITRMSERKTAPIIAAMNPDKARTLTIMMAEQNKLPELPVLQEGP